MRRLLFLLLLPWLCIAPALAQQAITLEVAEAVSGFDPVTGEPTVTVTLTEDGRRALADFTTANVGLVIEIVVNDEVVLAPMLRSPILGGILSITGGLASGEADALAEAIGTPRAPLTLRLKDGKAKP